MKILKSNRESIAQAAQLICDGHLVGVPTETVYGLAADATNDRAVALIYETKRRPCFNPLIVHVASLEQALLFVEFTPVAKLLAKAFWPGPLTLVLPQIKNSPISPLVSAGLDTIAIRFPNHEVMRALILAAGCPLAAPSANPSGRISPTQAQHVFEGFQGMDEPKLILDGGSCEVGLESTVVDGTGSEAVILRPGGLSIESIKPICPVHLSAGNGVITSPGMLEKHYAPQHKIRLNATNVRGSEVLLSFGPSFLEGAAYTLNLSPNADLVEAAANFFSMLHQLDGLSSSGIAVMPIPNEGLGAAINDRLRRAAQV
jgi:L-threonylcarbamoyladenylate synthase